MLQDSIHYIPLARRYRPSEFSDLIGQETLTTTLTNAIIHNKIANAYLFSGTRGIGKTTSARIVAKLINCTNKIVENNNIKACLSCKNCTNIQSNNHPDILEIDAASRTSVDDIRSIIEGADYKPLIGQYKVFIIDEVHMLSKSAFNALLKTLEEPPLHSIFIFATTELHKIPLTILSRCQRFDLRRLRQDEITHLLKNITNKENINITQDALEFISIKADGSARDAISMLDQASSLSSNNNGIIDFSLISGMLGSTNLDIVIDFLSCIVEKDSKKAVYSLGEIYRSNIDPMLFFENLLNVIGYSIKIKAIKGYKQESYDAYHYSIDNIIKNLNLGNLTLLWQIFSKAILELKSSNNLLLSSEIAVIKAIYASSLPTPKEALESIIKDSNPRHNGVDTAGRVAIITPDFPEIKKENPISDIDQNTRNKTKIVKNEDVIVTIESLLRHLREKKEFELYYYLFNESFIEIISQNTIEISTNKMNRSLNNNLIAILASWTSSKWTIVTKEVQNFSNLRESLKEKFFGSKEWEIISKKFEKAELVDILLK